MSSNSIQNNQNIMISPLNREDRTNTLHDITKSILDKQSDSTSIASSNGFTLRVTSSTSSSLNILNRNIVPELYGKIFQYVSMTDFMAYAHTNRSARVSMRNLLQAKPKIFQSLINVTCCRDLYICLSMLSYPNNVKSLVETVFASKLFSVIIMETSICNFYRSSKSFIVLFDSYKYSTTEGIPLSSLDIPASIPPREFTKKPSLETLKKHFNSLTNEAKKEILEKYLEGLKSEDTDLIVISSDPANSSLPVPLSIEKRHCLNKLLEKLKNKEPMIDSLIENAMKFRDLMDALIANYAVTKFRINEIFDFSDSSYSTTIERRLQARHVDFARLSSKE